MLCYYNVKMVRIFFFCFPKKKKEKEGEESERKKKRVTKGEKKVK